MPILPGDEWDQGFDERRRNRLRDRRLPEFDEGDQGEVGPPGPPPQFGIGPLLRHGAPGTPVGLQGEPPSGIPSPEETELLASEIAGLAEGTEHVRQRRAREEQMLLEQEQERLSWEPREFGGRFFGEIPDRGTPAPAPSTPPAPPPPTPTPPRTPLSPIEEAARRYGYGFQPPVEAAGTPLQPAGLSPIEALLRAASEDVPYLRGEPFRTNEEQAMVERAKGRIRANFDMERQRARDSAGAYNRPLAPMLDDINRREQEALAEVDQGLMAATAGERRSRLGESRQLLSFLEALERQRQMEAMGIEMGLDEQELQRILTAVQLASGLAPAGQTTSMADRILQYALGAGQQAQQRMGQSTSGMGNLAYLWGLGGR